MTDQSQVNANETDENEGDYLTKAKLLELLAPLKDTDIVKIGVYSSDEENEGFSEVESAGADKSDNDEEDEAVLCTVRSHQIVDLEFEDENAPPMQALVLEIDLDAEDAETDDVDNDGANDPDDE